MRKKIKKKIDFVATIFGRDYQIKFVDQILSPVDGHPCCGLCDSEGSVIYINNKMDKELTNVTFFHEIFHAYCRRMGLENSGLSEELEELIADQFAKVIEEVLDFEI